jgi:hypothetical protein
MPGIEIQPAAGGYDRPNDQGKNSFLKPWEQSGHAAGL